MPPHLGLRVEAGVHVPVLLPAPRPELRQPRVRLHLQPPSLPGSISIFPLQSLHMHHVLSRKPWPCASEIWACYPIRDPDCNRHCLPSSWTKIVKHCFSPIQSVSEPFTYDGQQLDKVPSHPGKGMTRQQGEGKRIKQADTPGPR